MKESNLGSNWKDLNLDELLQVSGGSMIDGPYGKIHGNCALITLTYLYNFKASGWTIDQTIANVNSGDPDFERFARDFWDKLSSRDSQYLGSLLEEAGIAYE